MKSENDKIKNIFNSKLKDFEPELPQSLWGKIESDLSSRKQEQTSNSKKISIRKYWLSASAVAAILLAVFLFYPTIQDNQKEKQILAKEHLNEKSYSEKKIDSVQEDPSGVIKTETYTSKPMTSVQNELKVVDRNKQETIEARPKSVVHEEKIKPSIQEEILYSEKTTEVIDKERDQIQTELSVDIQDPKLLAYGPPVDSKSNPILSNEIYRQQKKKNGLEIGLGGSSGFSKANDVQMQLRHASLINYSDNENPLQPVKEQPIKLEHNQPLSFGFAVNKKINDRFSIETGIVYSYLRSRAKSAVNSNYKLRDSQHLHYLGLPLSMNIKLAEWKKLNLYSSLGGMIQKDFYGRMYTVRSIENLNLYELTKKNIEQDHPQYSLNGSLGMSYPIYNKLSLYSNFGVSYYFHTNNKYETIYSDRKWIFNLNVGLKFGF